MPAPTSTLQRWRFAIKPASWPKLLVPTALGQLLAAADTHAFSPAAALTALAFTLADGLFIVLLNDWGDVEVDRLKRAMFPHSGSPKTIPDGILPASHVLAAGLASGVAALFIAALAALAAQRPELLWIGVGCLGLFVAYTLPPLRLNYRGGGELLEALGVGAALPWFGIVAQTGALTTPSLLFLPGAILMAASSALASGLSDEESDRRGGKRTFTTAFGNAPTRRAAEISLLAGPAAWILAGAWLGPHHLTAALIATAAAAPFAWKAIAASHLATTNAFDAHRTYKLHLHRAIWLSSLALGLAIAVNPPAP